MLGLHTSLTGTAVCMYVLLAVASQAVQPHTQGATVAHEYTCSYPFFFNALSGPALSTFLYRVFL